MEFEALAAFGAFLAGTPPFLKAVRAAETIYDGPTSSWTEVL